MAARLRPPRALQRHHHHHHHVLLLPGRLAGWLADQAGGGRPGWSSVWLLPLPPQALDQRQDSKLLDDHHHHHEEELLGEEEGGQGRDAKGGGRAALLAVSGLMARQHLQQAGQPVKAACCHLAVRDGTAAIQVGKGTRPPSAATR